ncbi:MAG: ribonuclease III domain-containing protein [Promethearchaeota archaeon]
MSMIDKDKTKEFQEFIEYKFKNEEILVHALTTPRLANKYGIPSYEFLENLGDAVIKLIFILKLYKIGIVDPGEITKIKAVLESDNNLKKVASKIGLDKFIFKTEKQRIKGTRIPADVFEAICGALFLDSSYDLILVEQKIIDPFYGNIEQIIQNSIISDKNVLLEFLQEKYKKPISIELEYQKKGLEHDPIWVAHNPIIIDKKSKKELIKITTILNSGEFRSKKEAEKDIYKKILKFLLRKEKAENGEPK